MVEFKAPLAKDETRDPFAKEPETDAHVNSGSEGSASQTEIQPEIRVVQQGTDQTSLTLSQASLDLFQEGESGGLPNTARTADGAPEQLQTADGSAVLAFNPDWLSDVQPSDRRSVRTPTAVKPEDATVPAARPGGAGAASLLTPDSNGSAIPQLAIPNMPSDQPEGFETSADSAPDDEVFPKKSEFLPERIPSDPSKRTVVVLDKYGFDEMFLKGDHGFSHGELNARLAEENGYNAGYNVIRMQVGMHHRGAADIAESLQTLNQAIEDGDVKLGEGDLVNVSLGVMRSFDAVSEMLGMEITAENVKEKRAEILETMRAKADDKTTPRDTRAFFKQVLNITEGVETLQERGIKVVTAAGNDGTDEFNVSLLAADRQYSALTADGKPADYSARNSLTTDARADIDFYAMPVNVFDKTPFELQTGSYRVDGTGIHISARDFGGMYDGRYQMSPEAQAVLFSSATAGDGTSGYNVPLTPANLDSWRSGTLVLSVQGTSFANAFGIPRDYPQEQAQ